MIILTSAFTAPIWMLLKQLGFKKDSFDGHMWIQSFFLLANEQASWESFLLALILSPIVAPLGSLLEGANVMLANHFGCFQKNRHY